MKRIASASPLFFLLLLFGCYSTSTYVEREAIAITIEVREDGLFKVAAGEATRIASPFVHSADYGTTVSVMTSQGREAIDPRLGRVALRADGTVHLDEDQVASGATTLWIRAEPLVVTETERNAFGDFCYTTHLVVGHVLFPLLFLLPLWD